MMFFPGDTVVKPQARGVVLIVGSDKNPVGTVLCPLVNAVATGNGVVIRPSETATKCAGVLQQFVSNFLDNRFYHCLGSGHNPDVLAAQPFDFICFTGEEALAKKILLAASANLIPVHLELEYICPVIVDSSADIEVAATK